MRVELPSCRYLWEEAMGLKGTHCNLSGLLALIIADAGEVRHSVGWLNSLCGLIGYWEGWSLFCCCCQSTCFDSLAHSSNSRNILPTCCLHGRYRVLPCGEMESKKMWSHFCTQHTINHPKQFGGDVSPFLTRCLLLFC